VRECAELVVLDPTRSPTAGVVRSRSIRNALLRRLRRADSGSGWRLSRAACVQGHRAARARALGAERSRSAAARSHGRPAHPADPSRVPDARRRINWPHGGTITLTHLRERMNGRLESTSIARSSRRTKWLPASTSSRSSRSMATSNVKSSSCRRSPARGHRSTVTARRSIR